MAAALGSGLWEESSIYTKFALACKAWDVNGHERSSSRNSVQRTAAWRAKNRFGGKLEAPTVQALDDLMDHLQAADFTFELPGLSPMKSTYPPEGWLETLRDEVERQLPRTAEVALAALKTLDEGGMDHKTVYNKARTLMSKGGFGYVANPKKRHKK